MIGGPTKALLFMASLPPLVCIGLLVWIGLLPYYANNSRFVIFHFHFTPWSWIWVGTLVAGLISFLYDRRTIRKL
jgi:cell division protein FtsW (lipid II flippase)